VLPRLLAEPLVVAALVLIGIPGAIVWGAGDRITDAPLVAVAVADGSCVLAVALLRRLHGNVRRAQ